MKTIKNDKQSSLILTILLLQFTFFTFSLNAYSLNQEYLKYTYIELSTGLTPLPYTAYSYRYNPSFSSLFNKNRSVISSGGINTTDSYYILYEKNKENLDIDESVNYSHIVKSLISSPYGNGINFLSGYTSKNFALHISHTTELNIFPDISTQQIPIFNISITSDNILSLNYSNYLINHQSINILWGININYINRGILSYSLYPINLIDFSYKDINQFDGQKLSTDIGFSFLFYKNFLLSLEINNIFSSPWHYKSQNANFIISDPTEINFGFYISYPLFIFGIYFKDLTNNKISIWQRQLHSGIIILPYAPVSFELGINDGYLSWGITLKFKHFICSYYSIRRELSDYLYLKSYRIHGIQVEIIDFHN